MVVSPVWGVLSRRPQDDPALASPSQVVAILQIMLYFVRHVETLLQIPLLPNS